MGHNRARDNCKKTKARRRKEEARLLKKLLIVKETPLETVNRKMGELIKNDNS